MTDLNKRIAAAVQKDKTALQAAAVVYTILREEARLRGMNPDIEVGFFTPEQAYQGNRNAYAVSFEAGPDQWAISASFAIINKTGRLVECYYSFDLLFYLDEWEKPQEVDARRDP